MIVAITGQLMVIGAADTCHVQVRDPYVSPRHCALRRDATDTYVTDLGSTNGTMVVRADGSTVRVPLGTWVAFCSGDSLRVGRTMLPWASS